MKELIKINTNEEGKQLVSARELYLGLGLNKSNWSRWYPTNILKNDFFNKNTDWIGVRRYDEGNEIQDFAISLDFAKHIAMMARTEKSHEYRNYFIKCEKVLNEQTKPTCIEDILIKSLQEMKVVKQTALEAKEEAQDIRNDFEDFKKELPLIGEEPEELQAVVRRVGTKALGGKKSPAYCDKSISKKVYQSVWKYIKDQFNVKKYKAIKRKYLSKAIELAESYKAPFHLQEEIDMINNQGKLDV
jgi:anti-repressor protein|nr:MAG TPA: antirepressor protein [Caudoviricetes sp.]